MAGGHAGGYDAVSAVWGGVSAVLSLGRMELRLGKRLGAFYNKHKLLLFLIAAVVVAVLLIVLRWPEPEIAYLVAGALITLVATGLHTVITTSQEKQEKSNNVRLMLLLEIDHNLTVVREIDSKMASTIELAKGAKDASDFSFAAHHSLQRDIPGALSKESLERTIRLYSLLEKAARLIRYSQWVGDEERRQWVEKQTLANVNPRPLGPADIINSTDPRHDSIRHQWIVLSRQIAEVGNPLAGEVE